MIKVRITESKIKEKKNCGCGQDPCITYGKLEEAERINMERGEMLQALSELSDEELARLLDQADLQQRSSESISEDNDIIEEFAIVDDHFDIYEAVQDAIDENGETPCPQCLYEILADEACGCSDLVSEAEYQGRKVKLNKPMRGDVKKSKVYVKNAKGNVVKVNFGDPNMTIKKSNPARRKSFRARHNCKSPGPKWKARYWSCRAW